MQAGACVRLGANLLLQCCNHVAAAAAAAAAHRMSEPTGCTMQAVPDPKSSSRRPSLLACGAEESGGAGVQGPGDSGGLTKVSAYAGEQGRGSAASKSSAAHHPSSCS